MADDWINSIDLQVAKKDQWNRVFLRKSFPFTDTTKTANLFFFSLNRPFDNTELVALKAMFLSTTLTDAQLLTRLKAMRSNIADAKLVGGITLPADLIIENHNYSFDVRANLRIDPYVPEPLPIP